MLREIVANVCLFKWSVFSWNTAVNKGTFMITNSDQLPERKFAIGCTITTYSDQYAPQIFKTASGRLLDVNRWHSLSDSLLPAFSLVDDEGCPLSRPARKNDLVRIHPAGTKDPAMDGLLKIESVEYKGSADNESETLTIGVSTISKPFYKALGHARILASDAITTFRVFRNGLNITAELLNNVNGEGRVVESPVLGVYKIQWRSFINGILTDLRA